MHSSARLIRYDPNVAPDSSAWTAIGESRAIALVARHHRSAECEHPPAPEPRMHAMIHVVVENQVALGAETPVATTLERLRGEGLSRHEALHAIGSVLGGHLFGALRGDADDREAPLDDYCEQLKALTAKSWLQSGNLDAPTQLAQFSDDYLIDLLFTEGDGLPRAVVNEIIARRDRLTTALIAVVIDPRNWTETLPEWWAPIHAVFILGAIDDPIADTALFSALRDAEAHDCDWLAIEMPSILGRRGARVRPLLSSIITDRSTDLAVRAVALRALAATTLADEEGRDAVFATIGGVFSDRREERSLRSDAGQVLLDFQIAEYRGALSDYARAERLIKHGPIGLVPFSVEDVGHAFVEPSDLHWYRRDWLAFYDPAQIASRQERWAREDADRKSASPPDAQIKVGRNNPCPCGSGKKYKKCCLA